MKFYKFVSSLVFTTILFNSSVSYALKSASVDFPDVPKGTQFYEPIKYLQSHNVINGYDDGTFKPNKKINRAEAIKILVKGFDLSVKNEKKFNFPDVKKDDWFYEYVATAFSLGIVDGYDDGSFKPANNINVAESLKVILLSYDKDISNGNVANDPYPDVKKDEWYAVYANYSKNKQIIAPLGDGQLHGERDITRGEFARVIYRLMYIKENNLDEFPISKNWPSVSDNNLGISVKYPFEWEKVIANDQIIFWKRDKENGQLSWARVYPNGASLVFVVDENKDKLGLDNYLKQLKYDKSAQIDKMVLNDFPFISVVLSNSGILDYYFELPDKRILVAYCQVGSGDNQPQLIKEIRNIIGSVVYIGNSSKPDSSADDKDDDLSVEKLLSTARKNILIPKKGFESINLFDDSYVIETDSIGIGTGPVDYYYSKKANATFKLERNSDTLLGISNGEITSF